MIESDSNPNNPDNKNKRIATPKYKKNLRKLYLIG